jgi:lysophospholipase L1-like esterase
MRTFAVNTLIALIAIGFALLVCELFLRLFTKEVYPILQTDTEVGTIHKPNIDRKIWNDEAGRETHVRTNSLGYIGADRPLDKNADTVRIALLGDSMVESLQVDHDAAFPVLLDRALNDRRPNGKGAEVMNYGVGGAGTFLEYQTYKKNVAPYHPDIVILFLHSNDFADNMNKINFDPERYAEDPARRPALKSFLLRFQLPKFIFVRLQRSTAFLQFLDTLGLYEFNEYTKKAREAGPESVIADPQYYSFTFELIERMRERAEGDGARFVLLKMPDEYEYTERGRWETLEENAKIAEFAKEKDIEYFNPASLMHEAKQKEGVCLTFSCGGHMNESGHRALAEILYGYLSGGTVVTGR